MNALHATVSLVAFFIYGFSCYQIGKSMQIANTASSAFSLAASQALGFPMEQSNNGGDGSTSVGGGEDLRNSNETIAQLYRMSKVTRTKMTEKKSERGLPFKCGMVFYYHVPCTGGSTINKWLMQYTTEKDGTSSYYTHWGAGKNKDKVVIKQEVDNVERKFIEGMSKQVQNIGKNEWKISHAHINSMHLNASENLLFQWRSTVEAQGCQFIANVAFRDPLGHALSLHKHQAKCCSRANWSQHMYTQSELGHWEAQLDFFLYSKIDRNPHGVEPKEKVRRALELLQRHFDLVVVGDHDKYRNVILKLTGWEEKIMTRTNSYFGKLIFSKEDVQTIQKLIAGNGDEDFISKVKLLYQDSFSFLS